MIFKGLDLALQFDLNGLFRKGWAWARLAFGEFVNIRAGSNFAAFAGNLAGRGAYRLEMIWRRSSMFDTSAGWVFF